MKKLNRLINGILIIAILVILIPFLVRITYGPKYIVRRFTPISTNSTIKEIEEKIEANLIIRECLINNKVYKIGEGSLIKWAYISGPPMYVFDEEGILVDYTLDVGDDPRFKEKWQPFNCK